MPRKSSAQLDREIAKVLHEKKTGRPLGGEWGDLAPTGIRVESHSGNIALELATPVEIRREMNRRLTAYKALTHVPGRRKQWALQIYELARAKPWVMDQVPHAVWELVLTDIGRGHTHTHASTRKGWSRGERALEHGLHRGDRVRTKGVPRTSAEYDEGVVVEDQPHLFTVRWRRAGTTYREDPAALEKVIPPARSKRGV